VFSQEIRLAVEEELARGLEARAAQNEGRARVCARRSAGVAMREYLRLTGQPARGSSYDLLGLIQELDSVPMRVKVAARCLLAKVDENHNLTVEADLLEEARILARELEQLV
jgi:hypothetical protein